jgi:hypothetical protein
MAKCFFGLGDVFLQKDVECVFWKGAHDVMPTVSTSGCSVVAFLQCALAFYHNSVPWMFSCPKAIAVSSSWTPVMKGGRSYSD